MLRNVFKAKIWLHVHRTQVFLFLFSICYFLVSTEIPGTNKDKLEPGMVTYAYNSKM